jgi:uncharacterized protein YegP (UPF0339 family)
MYFTIRKNRSGKYWWRAVADNNKILAASELMETKAACENGISVVKAGAATAPVYDKTKKTLTRRQL